MSPFAERFAAAVQVLISDGPIKQRLTAAYTLHLADITEADLPPPLRRDFADLNAAISRVAPAGHATRVAVHREAAAHQVVRRRESRNLTRGRRVLPELQQEDVGGRG